MIPRATLNHTDIHELIIISCIFEFRIESTWEEPFAGFGGPSVGFSTNLSFVAARREANGHADWKIDYGLSAMRAGCKLMRI